MSERIHGLTLVAGNAEGEALVTQEPLSFWGGFDARTGEIIDRRHELSGQRITDKVFVLPHGRGSSSGSGLLLEGIRRGTAPAALILSTPDPILALGAIVAREMYQKTLPIVVVSQEDIARLRNVRYLHVSESGAVSWQAHSPAR